MGKWNSILVGVDGSPASRKALEWAGEEALRHGSELVVLVAWTTTPPPLLGPTSTLPTHGATDFGETAKNLLLDEIKEVLGEDPPFLVRPLVREGNPAELLIDLAADADLLVVGSRGHGGFVGLLLGSVSQHVAAHAKCTVTVVR